MTSHKMASRQGHTVSSAQGPFSSSLPIALCFDRPSGMDHDGARCSCYLPAGHSGLHVCGHPHHGGWA